MQSNPKDPPKKEAKRTLNNSNNNGNEENPAKILVTTSKEDLKPLIKNGDLSAKQKSLLKHLNGEMNSKINIPTRTTKSPTDNTNTKLISNTNQNIHQIESNATKKSYIFYIKRTN